MNPLSLRELRSLAAVAWLVVRLSNVINCQSCPIKSLWAVRQPKTCFKHFTVVLCILLGIGPSLHQCGIVSTSGQLPWMMVWFTGFRPI